jgi:Ulp1 family protease
MLKCCVHVVLYLLLCRWTKAILRYLPEEAKDKKNKVLDMSNWTVTAGTQQIRGLPQQSNGVDCGMFATLFADFLSDDLPLAFSQEEILTYRKRFGAAILRGHLNYDI